MLHVYYCEYRVCGNFASRYVVASNKSKVVELIVLHYKTLSPYLTVSDINVRDIEFISSQTINNLHKNLHGNY